MSDNIDYAELDRAVNEAIKHRSTSVQSSVKTAVKPVTKAKPVAKTASRPVARTISQPITAKAAPTRPHGQFMDIMLPRATKPVAKTTPRPAIKPLARTTTPPIATKITTAPRPAITTRTAKVAAAAPRASRPSVATQIQQRQQHLATQTHQAPRPTVQPLSPATKAPARTPIATQVPSNAAKTAAPNANNYSLGVRSPFITNTKVEKRPLGTDIPETATSGIHSTKNIYSAKSPSKSTKTAKKHLVTEAPKKHSGWLWTLLVLFVIAAGGGLGYLAYILVFANQF